MKNYILLVFTALLCFPSNLSIGQTLSKEQFNDPPIQFWPRPLWFWNNTTVTGEEVVLQMQAYRDKCGYGGFGIVPFRKNFKPEYLSDDYFRVYGQALAKAKELGLTMSLYDEYGFPSGSAGAFTEGDDTPRFQTKFPEQTIKRLDKEEDEISGPLSYEKEIPEGKLMGVVAMEINSLRRIDITDKIYDGLLKWNVPSGKWKIMIFYCVKDGNPGVDYLNPEYVRNFIGMTHEAYYSRFKDYFGTVITGTFFDEPSMFRAKFRMWTDEFNNEFRKKYNFSPVSLYPALWYDIGTETQSARNCLFGFRAELYAEGFTKEVSDWSVAHGITATGHTAPEEVLNPVNSSGDLMKSFKYLEIPGIDKIGGNRPAERFYKLISSSAYNWDKMLVMSETYGAMPDYDKPGDLGWNDIYSIAMDQYAKGINMLIPHAVWYDDKNVTYKPELSHRNQLYADSLKVFTGFLSRLNIMLQKSGRHVADIAILYPIQSLLGEHYLDGPVGPSNVDGPVDPSNEYYKMAVAQIDYIDVANWLTNLAGKDFTFLHPGVLDEKCSIAGGELQLHNKINRENYKVFIVPSCKTISINNLRKIKDYYKNGGKVIFTTRLPLKSVEPGRDNEVISLIKSIFPKGEMESGRIYTDKMGGKACFIAYPDGQKLREILNMIGIEYDVSYPVNENIRYIHKIVDDHSMFYFANIGNVQIETEVTLRGEFKLEIWDPHDGSVQKLIAEQLNTNPEGQSFTRIKLNLKPFHSCFWIEE
jgi:hypothetical protein